MSGTEQLFSIFFCRDCSKLFASSKWKSDVCPYCKSENTLLATQFHTKSESDLIIQNANILIKLLGKKDRESVSRRNLAIYRLFKAEFKISTISQLFSALGYSKYFANPINIQNHIGKGFKEACLRSGECWAQKLLKNPNL